MKGFLTKNQRKELLRELSKEDKRRYADRIRVILLLDEGETYSDISKFLFLDEGTIANYRRRYKEGGVEGLIIDDYKGKRSYLSESEQSIVVNFLESKVCLSTKEIIDYIERKFDISYSVSGITDLLHRIGFTYKKVKAVPGKANRKKQEQFIVFYRDLVESEKKVYFADSTHPQHNPVISYGWIKKGEDFNVLCNSGRYHLNINGAVDIQGLDVVTRTSEWVNSSAICDLLKAIRMKNNGSEETIYFVLDNAPYYRSEKVKLTAEELGIKLVYLPPYSHFFFRIPWKRV
jgi:transposase